MPDDITACPDPTEGVGVAESSKRAPQEAAVPVTPSPAMERAGLEQGVLDIQRMPELQPRMGI